MFIQDFKIKIYAVPLYMIIKGDKLVLNLVPVLSMVLVLVLNLTTITVLVQLCTQLYNRTTSTSVKVRFWGKLTVFKRRCCIGTLTAVLV
jgi:hypothetical protein